MRHRAAPAALAMIALAGCADPVTRYVGRRAVDLADCFKASAGVGVPAYLRVKATDLAVVGAGFAIGYRVGWHGRYGGGLIGPAGVITNYGVSARASPFGATPRANGQGDGRVWPTERGSASLQPWGSRHNWRSIRSNSSTSSWV